MTDTYANDYLFGLVKYTRVGEISCLMIFRRHVYKRVGHTKSLFGFVWGGE